MKHKFLLTGLILLFSLSLSAETHSGTCGAEGDNLTWTLDTESGVLTISGTGEMNDYGWYEQPWYSYRVSIKSAVISDGVTSIGDRAFSYCSSLTSVTIGNSVTSIGYSAFGGCHSLTSVTIGNSVANIGFNAFEGCSSLTSVHISDIAGWSEISFGDSYANPLYYAHNLYLNGTLVTDLIIPNSVTSIRSFPFYGCSSLTSVTIPSSVTNISWSAFEGCINLTKVTLNSNTITSKNYNGSTSQNAGHIFGSQVKEFVFGEGVTSIGNYAFYLCNNLTSVTIGNSVTSIGYSAFGGCYSLTSVTIGNSVTSIRDDAFSSCYSLTTINVDAANTAYCDIDGVLFNKDKTTLHIYPAGKTAKSYTIPNSVTLIEAEAFCYSTNLISVTIPNSVYSIGTDAFLRVNNIIYNGIASYAPWGAKTMNGYVEGWMVYSDAGKTILTGCSSLATGEIIIPNSVTSIGDDAFIDCSNLTSITVPNSVTSIGERAFVGCSGLTSITIPNGVISIGNDAFGSCSSLTSIEIPQSVTYIGSSAFYECNNLTSITCKAVTPPQSGNSIINKAIALYVPCQSVEAYWNADGWNEFSGIRSYEEECSEYYGNWCGDNLTWSLDGGTLTISGTGPMWDFEGNYNMSDPYSEEGEGEYNPDAFSYSAAPWFDDRHDIDRIVLSDGVTSIGDYAFMLCFYVETIEIPNTLTHIGEAFYECAPREIRFNGSLEEWIGKSWNSNLIYDGFSELTTFDDSYSLYINDTEVSEVIIPNSVTSIGDYTFYHCRSLTSVTIPNSVTSIGKYAFRYYNVYSQQTVLTSVTCEAVTPPALGDYAFDGNTSAPLYVPCASKEAYRNAEGWSSFSDIRSIEEECDETPETCSIASGECGDDLAWVLSCDGVLTISGKGAMTYWRYASDVPWYANRESIVSAVIENGVTDIGKSAFTGCGSLTSVTIPNSVTSIGEFAFDNCRSLTSVNIPNSVTSIGECAFQFCGSLTSVTIPGSVTSIGLAAFNYCSSLTSVTIPSSVTSIGLAAFKSCNTLTRIICEAVTPPRLGYGYSSAFDDTSIPLYVPCASKGAYHYAQGWIDFTDIRAIEEDCTDDVEGNRCGNNLTWTLEDGTLTITGTGPMWDFAGEINMYGTDNWEEEMAEYNPDQYSYSAAPWFEDRHDITSIVLSDGVTSIGDYAFMLCYSAGSIVIPNTLTSIGGDAFFECAPEAIHFTGTVEDWINKSWNSNLIYDGFSALTNFDDSYSLYINDTEVSEVIIPNSVTSIGDYTFYHCRSLTSVTIPNSVTSIGYQAFFDCSHLTSITCEAVTPPALGDYAFDGSTSIPLYVPCASKEAYRNAEGWSAFTDIRSIEENCDETPETCSIASGECGDNLAWVLSCDGVLTISGTGSMWGYYFDENHVGTAPWNPYIDMITSAVIENGVTSIGSYAFYSCYNLTSIEIPEGVSWIGEGAFLLTGLTDVVIPNSVYYIDDYAFLYVPLGNLWIPDGVEYIGRKAFADCREISMAYIGKGVTSIGEEAFKGCNNIWLDISGENTVYDNREYCNAIIETATNTLIQGFNNTQFIPATVTNIAYGAFDDCDWSGCHSYRESLTCQAVTPPVWEGGMADYSSVILYVPCASVEAYRNAEGWSAFPDIRSIEEDCFSGSSIDMAEWEILQNIHADLLERNWSDPWDLSGGPQSVVNISDITISDGHVVALNLNNRNLTGTFPVSILALPRIESLVLSDNHFTGTLEDIAGDNLDGQTSLTHIEIQNNAFEGNIGSFAALFPNLVYLDAADNRLSDVSPVISPAVAYLDIRRQFIPLAGELRLNGVSLEDALYGKLPQVVTYNHSRQTYDNEVETAVSDEEGFSSYVTSEGWKCSGNSDSRVYKGQSGGLLKTEFRYPDDTEASSYGYYSVTFNPGDANFDGMIDITDLQTTVQYVLSQYDNCRPFNFTAANLYADGDITVQDVVLMVDRLLGIVQYLPGRTSPSRGQDGGMSPATLTWKDGELHLFSTVGIAAVDLIVRTSEPVQWMTLEGQRIKTSVAGDSTHTVIYSMKGVTFPAMQDIVIARVADRTAHTMTLKSVMSDADANRVKAGLSNETGAATGLDDLETGQFHICTENAGITVNTTTSLSVSLYDVSGKLIASRSGITGSTSFAVPKGAYLLHIVDHSTSAQSVKKVVIR